MTQNNPTSQIAPLNLFQGAGNISELDLKQMGQEGVICKLISDSVANVTHALICPVCFINCPGGLSCG